MRAPKLEMSSTSRPIIVGLTGGIGSGKTSVSARLALLGACVVDSDLISRQVVLPGSEGLAQVVARFGEEVLASDGTLDRRKLGDIVFADKSEIEALNFVLHPLIEAEIKKQVGDCLADGGIVAVVVLPLLVETRARERYRFDKVIAVDAPEEVVTQRLITSRSMSEAEVRDRIANQATRTQRINAADFVIDNTGDLAHLEREVERVWRELMLDT